MTQTTGRFFDELAKMMTNAAGMAEGLKAETQTVMRAQAERILRDLEVVQREEFEAVREMAVKAREENERLEQRIAELEAALASKAPAAKPATRKRSAAPDMPEDPAA
jgi:BMFP domain-containing protein YqiC